MRAHLATHVQQDHAGVGARARARGAARLSRGLRVAIIVLVSACGEDGCDDSYAPAGSSSNWRCGSELWVVSGNGQIGQVQLPLDSTLRVRAMVTPAYTGCSTRPDVGARVEWSVTGGGGAVSQAVSIADSGGLASTRWTLGAAVGQQAVQAVIRNTAGEVTASAVLTATGYSQSYRALRLHAGNNQAGAPGSTLPVRPEVVLVSVKEAGGPLPRIEQPLQLKQILFTVVTGGGSTSLTGNITALNGTAGIDWTLGPALGAQRLRAVVNDAATAPDPRDTLQVEFVANAASYLLRIVGGDDQTDTVGARLLPVTVEYVELLDAAGNTRRIAGTPVTWTVSTGGGTVVPAGAVTDNAGRASAEWRLGRTVGAQALRAAVPVVPNMPAAAFQVEFRAQALLVVDSVVVTPPQVTIQGVGNTTPLTAKGYFNQQQVPGLTFDWTSLNESIITVSPAGVVTARAAGGPVGVVAREQTSRKADTSFVTVIAPPPPPPARIAYALVDATSVAAGTANPAYAFNSGAGAITIQATGSGVYDVTFPNLETPAGGATAVLVSSFGQGTGWCKLDTWRNGPNHSLTATVRCFERTAPAAAEFTILVLSDHALPHRFGFAYGDRPGATTAYTPPDTASFNSSAQPITITRNSTGSYQVAFPGLARPAGAGAETVLLTAAGPQPVRCGLNTDTDPLAGTIALPSCADAVSGQTSVDSRFTLAVIDKGRTGMRWGSAYNGGREETGGTTLLPASQNSSGGSVSQTRPGTGRYDIRFGGLARPPGATEGVQLGAATGRGDFCKLLGWQNVGPDMVVQVQCLEAIGLAPEDQDFTILIVQ